MMIRDKKDLLLSVGVKIKEARKLKNISQDLLAEEIESTQQLISFYENGKRPIRINMLQEIAQVCGVSIHYFFLDSSEINEALDTVNNWPPELQTLLLEQVRSIEKAWGATGKLEK